MTEKAAGDQSIQEILERRSREEIGRFLLITTEQHDGCYILESITENHHVCKESRNLKKKKKLPQRICGSTPGHWSFQEVENVSGVKSVHSRQPENSQFGKQDL